MLKKSNRSKRMILASAAMGITANLAQQAVATSTVFGLQNLPAGTMAYKYDTLNGDVSVFYNGDPRVTGTNRLGNVNLLAGNGLQFIPSAFNGTFFSVATANLSTLNGSVLTGSIPDGYDLGHILPANLSDTVLASSLTSRFLFFGGGATPKTAYVATYSSIIPSLELTWAQPQGGTWSDTTAAGWTNNLGLSVSHLSPYSTT